MAAQEVERTTADVAWDKVEQGHRHLKDECQNLQSTCAGESSLSVLCFRLVILPSYGSIACLVLCMGALSDLEVRTTVEQRAQEVAIELVALTISRRAMCDVMLDAGRVDTQLTLHLDEARHRVDLLISEGIRSGVLATLMLVGSHYDSVDFDAVGQGY